MPSKAYQIFLDSMVMDFEKWHDGIGYDLKVLEQFLPCFEDPKRKVLSRKHVGFG